MSANSTQMQAIGAPGNAIFEELVVVHEEFFGSSTRRFVARQIMAHLGKQPEAIVPDDFPTLLAWMDTTVAMVSNDHDTRRVYAQKLQRIREHYRD